MRKMVGKERKEGGREGRKEGGRKGGREGGKKEGHHARDSWHVTLKT